MARKKKAAADEGDSGGSWLATYADMVTLLLAFFALLLSMAVMDAEKFNAFVESIRHTPIEVLEMFIPDEREQETPEGHVSLEESAMDTLYQMINEYIEEQGLSQEISISKIDDVIHVRFSNAIFFYPDSYTLLPDSLPILDFVGDTLMAFEEDIAMVNIMGFTATIDYGTYWMLSGNRAGTVANYLNYESGFETDKLTVLGYGRRFPVADNDTAEGMQQNRRVELIIVGTERLEPVDINQTLEQFYGLESEHGMQNWDTDGFELNEGDLNVFTDPSTGTNMPMVDEGTLDPSGTTDSSDNTTTPDTGTTTPDTGTTTPDTGTTTPDTSTTTPDTSTSTTPDTSDTTTGADTATDASTDTSVGDGTVREDVSPYGD